MWKLFLAFPYVHFLCECIAFEQMICDRFKQPNVDMNGDRRMQQARDESNLVIQIDRLITTPKKNDWL